MIQQVITDFLKRNGKIEFEASKQDGIKGGNYRTEKCSNKWTNYKNIFNGFERRAQNISNLNNKK